MITDFEVERRAIAEDVAFVEGVGGAEIPGTSVVFTLQECVEGVVLVG